MKKQMKFKLVIAMLFFAISYSNAQIQIGGGLGYGTEIESVGITIKGNYPFTEQIEGSGSFSYFFPNTSNEILELKFWELNVDGHYLLSSTEKFSFYPLAGLSIAGVKFDYANNINNPFITLGDVSNTELGLNIGAGGTLKFSEKMSGYGEVKYTISGFDQLVINIGILFQLASK